MKLTVKFHLGLLSPTNILLIRLAKFFEEEEDEEAVALFSKLLALDDRETPFPKEVLHSS